MSSGQRQEHVMSRMTALSVKQHTSTFKSASESEASLEHEVELLSNFGNASIRCREQCRLSVSVVGVPLLLCLACVFMSCTASHNHSRLQATVVEEKWHHFHAHPVLAIFWTRRIGTPAAPRVTNP